MMLRTALALILGFAIAPSLRAEEPKKLTVDELQGTWLFDAASRASEKDSLAVVWLSKLVIKDKTIAVDKFIGLKTPLKGKNDLDPAGQVGHIDLALEEFDLGELSFHSKIPAGVLAGVYRRDGERLRFCFHSEPGGTRPETIEDSGRMLFSFSVVKAPKGFQNFPKEIAVKVLTPDGKPAKGVGVGCSLWKSQNEKTKEYDGDWALDESGKTDGRGYSKFDYEDQSFMAQSVIAWDKSNKLVGFESISPASVAIRPEVTVIMKPVCNVKLNITCDELKTSGKFDHFHCYAETKSGRRIAFNSNASGQLDFLLPAGDFKLQLYGSEYVGSKRETLAVPKDRSEFDAPKMTLPPTALLSLLGKPAPALADVKGWKGDAVKLADLKGKVVLLEFWGYWCGPCIASMPVLFDLHEKFADKGLAIVGIHLDGDGEVDTAAKLDAKIAGFKKEVWKGKDLPFPVALTSGHRDDDGESRGGIAGAYGIRSYPSTILIDREGKVVGKFQARDSKMAIAMMEKLLKDDKK